MNHRFLVLLPGLTTSLSLGLLALPTHAQTAAQTPPPASGADAPLNPAKTRTLTDALTAMSRATRMRLVADSTVANLQVSTPAEPTTPENVETQLSALIKSLPKGATWARLYLPATRRPYSGDDVAAFAQAQAKLVGAFGGPAVAGTVDVFGQKIAENKAAPALESLNLAPVYLVTNPQERRPGFGLDADASRWGTMSPDERKAWTDRQAAQLATMDPNALSAVFQQNFQIFGSLMRQLPPDQRQTLMQGMVGPGNNIQVFTRPGTP